jgi:hypothetical protein
MYTSICLLMYSHLFNRYHSADNICTRKYQNVTSEPSVSKHVNIIRIIGRKLCNSPLDKGARIFFHMVSMQAQTHVTQLSKNTLPNFELPLLDATFPNTAWPIA